MIGGIDNSLIIENQEDVDSVKQRPKTIKKHDIDYQVFFGDFAEQNEFEVERQQSTQKTSATPTAVFPVDARNN